MQGIVLFKKHLSLILRDPTAYLARLVMFIFITIFFSIIYIAQRDLEQEQVSRADGYRDQWKKTSNDSRPHDEQGPKKS